MVLRNINNFSGINYLIADTTIAHYYGRSIFGKQVGQTTMTVSYLGKANTIPVNVYQGVTWGIADFSCLVNSICEVV